MRGGTEFIRGTGVVGSGGCSGVLGASGGAEKIWGLEEEGKEQP